MSGKKTKLTGAERSLYHNYLESVNGHNDSCNDPARQVEPRSQEDWVKLYRDTQIKVRREQDAKS